MAKAQVNFVLCSLNNLDSYHLKVTDFTKSWSSYVEQFKTDPIEMGYARPPLLFYFLASLKFAAPTTMDYMSQIDIAENQPSDCKSQIHLREKWYGASASGKIVVISIQPNPDVFGVSLSDFEPSTTNQYICVEGQLKGYMHLNFYVLIAASSTFTSGIPLYSEQTNKVAKILKVAPVLQKDNTYAAGKHPLGSFDIPITSEISFHFVSSTIQSSPGFIGFSNDYFLHYPTKSFDVFNATTLPPINDFNTVVYTHVWGHSDSLPLKGKFRIQFKGILSSFYVNNHFVLAGSSRNPEQVIEIITAEISLNSDHLMLTFVGYRLYIQSIVFTKSSVMFSKFVLHPLLGTQNITFPATNSGCTAHCVSCFDSLNCFECEEGYYLSGYLCVPLCDNVTNIVPVKNKYCMSSPANLVLHHTSPYYNTADKKIYINYSAALYESFSHIIIMYLPYPITHGNYPIPLTSLDPLGTLPEGVYAVQTVESSPAIINIQRSDFVGEGVTSTKTNVTLAVYGAIKGQYLFIKTSSQKRIAEIKTFYNEGTFPQDSNAGSSYFFIILDCISPCKFRMNYTSSVTITKNSRTVLFEDSSSNPVINYTLARQFTGVTYLEISATMPSSFSFNIISSNYKMYAPKGFIFEDIVTIVPTTPDSLISGCANQDKSKCLSCSPTFYLDFSSTKCLTTCTEGTENSRERICMCTSHSDCKNSLPVCDTDILTCRVCTADSECDPHTPYRKCNPSGQCSKCPEDCDRCLNETQCTICFPGFEIINGLCYKICAADEVRVARNICLPRCRYEYPFANGGCAPCNSDSDCNLFYPDQITKKCVGSQCIKCVDDCIKCATQSLCTECRADFHLKNPSTCERICSSNHYNLNRTTCVPTCSYDLPFSSGNCGACPNDNICIGLYPNQLTEKCVNKECIRCPEDCKTCSRSMYCDVCRNGFLVSNGICYIRCNPGNRNISRTECAETCGDGIRPEKASIGYCDDGNKIDGDGCSSFCTTEAGYYCKGGGPFSPDECFKIPSLSIAQNNDTLNEVILTFDQPYPCLEELQNQMKLRFSLEETIPKYHIVEKDNQTYVIVFELEKSIPDQILIFDFSETERIHTFLDDPKYYLPITGIPDLITIIRTKSINGMLKSLSTAAYAAVGVTIIFGGNPIAAWFLMNLIQQFYYLVFINIDYPLNVAMILGTFSVGRLPFIPQLPSFTIGEITESLPSPYKFEENELDGMFLKNSGSMLTVWAGITLAGVTTHIILAFSKFLPNHVTHFFRNIKGKIFWSGIIGFYLGGFMDMSLCSLLQIKSISMDTPIKTISSLLGIAILACNLIIPGLLLKKIRTLSSTNNQDEIEKFGVLIEDFKRSPKICRYYNIILLIRRFFLPLVLIFMHDIPLLQIVSALLAQGIGALAVLKYAPFKSPTMSFSVAIDEILTLTIYFIISLIHYANHQPLVEIITKENLGWGLIMCISISCLINITLMIFGSVCTMVDFVKDLNKKPVGEKMVIPAKSKNPRSIHWERTPAYQSEYMTFQKTKLVRIKN